MHGLESSSVCASGGGEQGKISPALTQGKRKRRQRKQRRGSRLPAGPSHVRTPGVQGPRAPRPGHPLQGAAGPEGAQPTHPRGRRDTSRRAKSEWPLTAARRAQQQQHHQGPHLRPRRGVAAAAGVWSRRRRRYREDQPPPPVTVRTGRLGGLAARRRAPAAPHPLPLPRGPRTRARPRPRPAATAVKASPSRLAASSSHSRQLPSGGARRASRSRPAAPVPRPPVSVPEAECVFPRSPGPHYSCPCLLFPFCLPHRRGPHCPPSTRPLLLSLPSSRFRNYRPRRCSAGPRSPGPSRAQDHSPLPGSDVLLRAWTLTPPRLSLLPVSPEAPPPAAGAHTAWGRPYASPSGQRAGGHRSEGRQVAGACLQGTSPRPSWALLSSPAPNCFCFPSGSRVLSSFSRLVL